MGASRTPSPTYVDGYEMDGKELEILVSISEDSIVRYFEEVQTAIYEYMIDRRLLGDDPSPEQIMEVQTKFIRKVWETYQLDGWVSSPALSKRYLLSCTDMVGSRDQQYDTGLHLNADTGEILFIQSECIQAIWEQLKMPGRVSGAEEMERGL